MLQFAVFLACLFGLPFPREIFMALPPLSLVSDAKSARRRARRIKVSRWSRFSQISARKTSAKTPGVSLAWLSKR